MTMMSCGGERRLTPVARQEKQRGRDSDSGVVKEDAKLTGENRAASRASLKTRRRRTGRESLGGRGAGR
jgi:hypothetical protein